MSIVENAKSNAANTRFGNKRASVYNTSIRDLGSLGLGIEMYFTYLKYVATTFTIMSIIVTPSILLTKSGNGFLSSEIDSFGLGYFSIGNLGLHPSLNNSDLCHPNGNVNCTTGFQENIISTDPHQVSLIISYLDLLSCVCFIVSVQFLRNQLRNTIKTNDIDNVTPKDFTVEVIGLPCDATEEEIIEHFNSRYDLTKPKHYYPLWLGFFGGKKYLTNVDNNNDVDDSENQDDFNEYEDDSSENEDEQSLNNQSELERTKEEEESKENSLTILDNSSIRIGDFPVQNLDHVNGNTMYLNKWVAHVSIAFHTKGMLRKLLKRGRLTKKIKIQKETLRICHEEKIFSTERQIKIEKKLARLEKKLEDKFISMKNTKNENLLFDVHLAFVTFQSVESKQRCLNDYRTSTSVFSKWFQPQSLRFREKYAIKVIDTGEPSNVIWENIETDKMKQSIRRTITFFITLLVLLLSGVLLGIAQTYQKEFKKRDLPASICDTVIPQVAWGSDELPPLSTYKIKWNKDEQCPIGNYHITYIFEKKNENHHLVSKSSNRTLERCGASCVSPSADNDPICGSIQCFNNGTSNPDCSAYKKTDIITCYCKKTLIDLISVYGFFKGSKMMWNEEAPCQIYLDEFITRNALIYASALFIIIINLSLKFLFRYLGKFERHSSESRRASAVTMKVFFSTFLNTALIILLLNTKFPGTFGRLFNGEYKDFSREWYATVGSSIATTMLINVVVPHIGPVFKTFFLQPIKRTLLSSLVFTQEEMNVLYEGPSFTIEERYPLVLNTVFVTMFYSSGIPILLPISAISLWIIYFFEKMTILKLYTVRIAYDETLCILGLNLLYWALLFHLGVAVWMLGNSELLPATLIDLKALQRALRLQSLNAAESLYELERIDPLGKHGLLPKIVRLNVFPIFIMLLLYIICLIFATFGYKVLMPLFDSTILKIFHCFKNIRDSIMLIMKDIRDNDISDHPLYTGVFHQIVKKSYKLSSLQKHSGYYLQENKADSKTMILFRKWIHDTTSFGKKRKQGDFRLTWEAFQTSCKNYEMRMNEKYKNAAYALENLMDKVDERIAKEENYDNNGRDDNGNDDDGIGDDSSDNDSSGDNRSDNENSGDDTSDNESSGDDTSD